MNGPLRNDLRVRQARRVLTESVAEGAEQVDAARWWGRLELALTAVLDMLDEEPPF